jgi:hypothetical protein
MVRVIEQGWHREQRLHSVTGTNAATIRHGQVLRRSLQALKLTRPDADGGVTQPVKSNRCCLRAYLDVDDWLPPIETDVGGLARLRQHREVVSKHALTRAKIVHKSHDRFLRVDVLCHGQAYS